MKVGARPGLAALCLAIALAAGAASAAGVFLRGDGASADAVSIRGERYQVATGGVYRWNALRIVAEGLGWDIVTLFAAVPAMLAAVPFVARGSFRGRLFAAGMAGYFFYQYLMYSLAWALGPLFLLFIAIYAASAAAIAWLVASLGLGGLASRFSDRFPRKGMAVLCLVLAGALLLMWLARIADTLAGRGALLGQTTLVVQALDLGFIVPLSVFTAIAALNARPVGYFLCATLVVKAAAMAAAICAMLLVAWELEGRLEVGAFVLFAAAAVAALASSDCGCIGACFPPRRRRSRRRGCLLLDFLRDGLGHGPEHVVPERNAHTEAHVRAGPVVLHVLVAAHRQVGVLRPAVVQRVVRHVVPDVAAEESGEHGIEPHGRVQDRADDEAEEPVADQRQRDAHRGRHHQACLAQRLRMVDAVHHEEDPLEPLRGRVIVEEEPMQRVLREGPDEPSGRKPDRNPVPGMVLARSQHRQHCEQEHHGGPQDQDRERGHVREGFQEIRLEKPYRLAIPATGGFHASFLSGSNVVLSGTEGQLPRRTGRRVSSYPPAGFFRPTVQQSSLPLPKARAFDCAIRCSHPARPRLPAPPAPATR